MTKIYEALLIDQHDHNEILAEDEYNLSEIRITVPIEIQKNLKSLYQNLFSLIGSKKHFIFQFVSSKEGEGTSTLTRWFAQDLAFNYQKSVLLLDADYKKPSHLQHFNLISTCGWDEAIKNEITTDTIKNQVGNTSLCISSMSKNTSLNLHSIEPRKFELFFASIKNEFDITIIDSPPVSNTIEPLALCRYMDGIVLVIETEVTKCVFIEKAIELIRKHNGNLLGVVLNKRKYYIPKFIYKWI